MAALIADGAAAASNANEAPASLNGFVGVLQVLLERAEVNAISDPTKKALPTTRMTIRNNFPITTHSMRVPLRQNFY